MKYQEALKKKVFHETNSSDAEEISEELEVSFILRIIHAVFVSNVSTYFDYSNLETNF